MELSCSVGSDRSSTANVQLEGFIEAINDYLNNKTENNAVILKKLVKASSVRMDVKIFDPDKSLGAQFYACLYQLMVHFEPDSAFLWDCVELLTNICRNCSARRALIDTYQFAIPLSRLISDQLSNTKKKILLSLLQDLTCGIKVSWNFTHLPEFVTALARWVEAEDSEIVCLSLGVLVNLCFKNLSAIYTLSRAVDMKKFLRYCLPLRGPLVELHVCKLMIIVNHSYDEIPKKTLVNLIEPTFLSIVDAFTKNDPIVLRIVIEFFVDIITKENIEFFREYKKYNEQINRIIELINARNKKVDQNSTPIEASEPDCVTLILKLIHTLEIKSIVDIAALHTKIIKLILDWVHSDKVCYQGLTLITLIAEKSVKPNDGGGDKDIVELLLTKMSVFLGMLQSDAVPSDMETCKRLSSVSELLRVMVKLTRGCPKLLASIDESILREVFDPVLEGCTINVPRLQFTSDVTTSTAAVDAYVQTLGLANELAQHDAKWLEFVCMLMEKRSVHTILAQALYGSSSSTKQLVLEICKYPRFPIGKVALALETMQNLFFTAKPQSQSESEINYPIMSLSQVQILNEILENFKKNVAEKDPSDVRSKDLMDLYEYKITSLAHDERYAIASAKAASERCTHLEHRLAQLTSEMNKMRQVLYRSENALEQIKKDMKEEQDMFKAKRRKADYDIEKREKALADLECKLESTKTELTQMTDLKKGLEEQILKKDQIILKLQENGTKMEKQLQKREEQITNANMHIDSLNMRNQDLSKLLDQKEVKLAEITKLYNSSKDIINTITKVAASQLP